MAVDKSSTNSKVRERIYKAIRHVSDCPLSRKVAVSAPIYQKKAIDEAISTEIPIQFNSPRLPVLSKLEAHTSVKKSGLVEKVASPNRSVETGAAPRNQVATTRFAEPDKAKPIVDTTPQNKVVAGSGQGKREQDLVKDKVVQMKEEGNGYDKFSSYINRTKAEIRTTSSIGSGYGGGGKSMSRRDSFNDRVSDYIRKANLKIRATSNVDR